jgi:hypothetical protein
MPVIHSYSNNWNCLEATLAYGDPLFYRDVLALEKKQTSITNLAAGFSINMAK